MKLARSTYYATVGQAPAEAGLTERIAMICAEFPAYGYRRVMAQLRLDGHVVNHKRVLRIMRQHDLSGPPRPRLSIPTDSHPRRPNPPPHPQHLLPLPPAVPIRRPA